MIAGISKGRQTRYAYLLLLPAVIIAVVFTYLPSCYVFFLSFKDWDLISPVKENAGFSNYVRLLASDSDFWNSLLRTFLYTVFFIPSTLILSLFIAIRILGLGKFKGFFQSMFFIPSVTSISVISLVWSYLFNPQIGPVNNFLIQPPKMVLTVHLMTAMRPMPNHGDDATRPQPARPYFPVATDHSDYHVRKILVQLRRLQMNFVFL